jgi:hypothetical protein
MYPESRGLGPYYSLVGALLLYHEPKKETALVGDSLSISVHAVKFVRVPMRAVGSVYMGRADGTHGDARLSNTGLKSGATILNRAHGSFVDWRELNIVSIP